MELWKVSGRHSDPVAICRCGADRLSRHWPKCQRSPSGHGWRIEGAAMTNATQARARRTIERIREIWAELDYAQRRLLEIRTGIPMQARRRVRKTSHA